MKFCFTALRENEKRVHAKTRRKKENQDFFPLFFAALRENKENMEEVMAFESLNAYKIMWLFVVFDLPVTEEEDRKNANRFRKDLLKDGFTMMQFSVYIRHCASKEAMETHMKRVERLVPPRGKVSMVSITDRQYGDIKNFWARKEVKPGKKPEQLELFF